MNATAPAHLVDTAPTGIFPSQTLRELIADGAVNASQPITDDLIQPASIDLRLGEYAWRVQASFLPGPDEMRGRKSVMEWLMWQMGGLGPMAGQAHHFRQAMGGEDVPYGVERYSKEVRRLYGVMDRRLAGNEWLGGADYSIADMACWPWVLTYKKQEIDLDAFPNVRRWYDHLKTRPGLRRGYEVGREFGKPSGTWDDEARKHLTAHIR